MKTVNGIYTSATIFSDNAEDYAIAQVKLICDDPAAAGTAVRIMPDVHPGNAGPVGLTMTVGNRILPAIVGIDIGCGITLAKVRQKRMEFQKLDTVIRDHIPAGFAVRKKPHAHGEDFDFSGLFCRRHINEPKAVLSLGSLGGGNHFIEIDRDDDGYLYIAIHSGSRHLGKEVAEYYLRAGAELLKQEGVSVPYLQTYLTGELMAQYLHDVQIVTDFAAENRRIMMEELTKGMKLKVLETTDCIHNYIGTIPRGQSAFPSASSDLAPATPFSHSKTAEHDNVRRIIRKGAISALPGEPLIIPANMRDGIILAEGRGNPEWNYSAPHGSGRIISREAVKNQYTVARFKSEMKGIHCSCIGTGTLDEAPFAYRQMEELATAIAPTASIKNIIKPVYNYKAGSGKRA